MSKRVLTALLALSLSAFALSGAAAQSISPDEARAIAKEAYIYGFPLVDSYRIQYSYFVDHDSIEFKAPWNILSNTARVFTPDDKAIQTPNSDTPYSTVGADLRAEPLVFTVPAVQKGRYYSLQFIDMYTFNFAYVGSRVTGNGAGRYLLVGPNWKGKIQEGVKSVIRSETDFAMILYRTQLFRPSDIGNVKKIQPVTKFKPCRNTLESPRLRLRPSIFRCRSRPSRNVPRRILRYPEFRASVLPAQSIGTVAHGTPR